MKYQKSIVNIVSHYKYCIVFYEKHMTQTVYGLHKQHTFVSTVFPQGYVFRPVHLINLRD